MHKLLSPVEQSLSPLNMQRVYGNLESLNLCGLRGLRGETAEIIVWTKNETAEGFARTGHVGKLYFRLATQHSKEPVFLSGFDTAMDSSTMIDDLVGT